MSKSLPLPLHQSHLTKLSTPTDPRPHRLHFQGHNHLPRPPRRPVPPQTLLPRHHSRRYHPSHKRLLISPRTDRPCQPFRHQGQRPDRSGRMAGLWISGPAETHPNRHRNTVFARLQHGEIPAFQSAQDMAFLARTEPLRT